MTALEITGPDYSRHEDPLVVRVGEELVGLYVRPNDLALFAFLGAVVADSQVFEFQVGGLLSAIEAAARLDGDLSIDAHSDKTIGWLANAFKKYCKDQKTAVALERARVARNHVVHGILTKYGWWHMSDSDYVACLREVREAREALWDGKEALISKMNDDGVIRALVLPLEEMAVDRSPDARDCED